ncbi:hypothetical protein B0J17DRAFT_628009 [Rhizoctonia solani]|nr:hypothetical protein B0J17DRAFT_628009 [Rhizoctonia solani]
MYKNAMNGREMTCRLKEDRKPVRPGPATRAERRVVRSDWSKVRILIDPKIIRNSPRLKEIFAYTWGEVEVAAALFILQGHKNLRTRRRASNFLFRQEPARLENLARSRQLGVWGTKVQVELTPRGPSEMGTISVHSRSARQLLTIFDIGKTGYPWH